MNHSLPEKQAAKPRILVAPLDWGLGHATRCIPIIRELLSQGAEVILAGEGPQEELLKSEFPGLLFLHLPGYKIRYAKTKRGLVWKMIVQGPKLGKAISAEHLWLKKTVQQYRPHAVISDNRFGLYHPGIFSVFITHQLSIKSPWGRWTEKILQQRNYRFINRFNECWVPDNEGDENYAGELSHPQRKPSVTIKYTGPLTRFAGSPVAEIKDHLLFILSGPEPQRSILENKIVNEISRYNGTATVVRGLPGNGMFIPSTNMIMFFNHLPAEELNREMTKAEFIISRSGYSTVMDALVLNKKCIFIPTPGQTEQEYIGRYLMGKNRAYCVSQNEFVLSEAIKAAKGFNYANVPVSDSKLLSKTISSFLEQLQAPALG